MRARGDAFPTPSRVHLSCFPSMSSRVCSRGRVVASMAWREYSSDPHGNFANFCVVDVVVAGSRSSLGKHMACKTFILK